MRGASGLRTSVSVSCPQTWYVCILKFLNIYCTQTSVSVSCRETIFLQLFFPICHENHWFVFIVAIRDGYFVFLDSCFGENHYFQEKARSVIVSNKQNIILIYELHVWLCWSVVIHFCRYQILSRLGMNSSVIIMSLKILLFTMRQCQNKI